jgi:hypothetical protein
MTHSTTREPHRDPEAVLKEIAHLAWGLGIHADILAHYADLGHVEGIELAAKDARACLVRLLDLRKGLGNA